MSFGDAVKRLPTENTAFNRVRFRWIKIVRGHPLLTAAQRHVALAIAQEFINRQPENPWFNSAWAAHQTIASKIGYTRRTVHSSMKALSNIGLIAIASGGGLHVPGGRTDRYTLRTDRLDLLEGVVHLVKHNDVKKFHISSSNEYAESDEKVTESGEAGEQMMGNSSKEDVKGLRTTLNNTSLETFLITYMAPPSSDESLHATKQAGNGRKEDALRSSAQDHLALAQLLGAGDVELGYYRIGGLEEGAADILALRYRLDRSAAREVLADAAELEIRGRSN
jgi:hypothetical protein